MLDGAGTTASRSPASRPATAPTCSTCVSTTSAATAPRTWPSWPGASPPRRPCRSCSTPPRSPVLRAGLQRLGGRCAVNSVNYEDGDGPESRFAQVMALVSEYGAAVVALTIDEEGQARTAAEEGRHRVAADRRHHRELGDADVGHRHRRAHLHHRHRPGGVAPRRHRDDRSDPRDQAPPPRRPDHARPVQHLLRAQPGRAAGAELGVPARMRPGGTGHRDRARVEDPADGPDPGRPARDRARPRLRPPS